MGQIQEHLADSEMLQVEEREKGDFCWEGNWIVTLLRPAQKEAEGKRKMPVWPLT